MFKRGEDSILTSWYFEIDRRLFWCVIVLFMVGLLAMVSAGSVAAERLNPPQPWHFFLVKAIPLYIIGIITLLVSSFLNRKQILLVSVANVAVCILLLLGTLVMPAAVKGSARWIDLGFASVMPSDLLKPGFIVITAWFLTRLEKLSPGDIFFTKRVWKFDGWPSYLTLFLPILLIILLHPDFGSFVLYLSVFAAMIFMAGLPMYFVPIFFGLGLGAFAFAFLTMAHVRLRVLGFLGLAGGGDNYQIKKSVEAVQHGGLFGQAEDSFIKQSLPDAHTDFVFSAIAEDSGAIIACILLLAFLYVLKRLAVDATGARDKLVFYACGGLMALFGVQMCINIVSALGLFPPKGMTLPFISYGGSSFVAFCLAFGMILALVREDKWK
ncbi:MAG: FtsW/RodA/SpoVE family cell cycle protein [Rickettsiales bacterium]|jgi:cell division protein FtsW|nr:FtsW/RodA/SpoVE family cell cycle protein [Rickettsiales bacterium]